MAEVGTYYITIMPDMSSFTSGVKGALDKAGTTGGKEYSSSFGDVLKGSAIGTALGNLATSAGRAIMGGLNNGIGRIDTIQNFPKVMQSLGYESGEADKSINLIMEHLDGLPTATQDVVGLTQAIADSTGDLDLATRAALGFNDMMLANGASAAEVTQAQGVFNRVLGKGNATVAQWQSLQSVMPAQLAAVAREMLGEGASVEELRDKLNDGTVSWDDFLGAIVKLDENDYMGATGQKIESFADQARANSVGIGTAIANVQNRIGAGWASILEAIGREDISKTIDNMSYGVREGMKKIADAIAYLKDAIGKTKIGENLKRLGDAIGGVLSSLWTDKDTQLLKTMTDNMVQFIDKVLQWLADHGEGVAVAIAALAGALVGLFGAEWIMKLPAMIESVKLFFTTLMANPFVLVVAGIMALVFALYTFFTGTEEGRAIWEGFCQIMSDLWNGLQEDWKVLCDTLSREWESFKAFIDGIPEWWQGVMDYWSNALDQQAENFRVSWEKIKQDFADAWEAIKQKASEVWEGIKTTVSTAVENVKTTLTNVWNAIKATLVAIWDGLKQKASDVWNGIKTSVTDIVNNIKTTLTNVWNAIKTAVTNAIESTKSNATSKWNAIKSTVSSIVDSIKSTISDKFNAAKDTVLGIFDNIKNGIRDKIQWAKDQVASIIEGIKGLFNFSWSLPAPRLPHIEWHWSDVGGLLSIPVFDGISWYAKGGIFDAASIIGIGEAGREAALPLNRRSYAEIAHGIASEMGGGTASVVVTGNTFIVRDEYDIDLIAEELARKASRENGAAA